MLAILFFITIFSSLTWAIYVVLYLNSQLAGNDLSSLAVSEVALYIGLLLVPIWVLWQIYSLISQHKNNVGIQKKLLDLYNQMKKNQDYTDLVVRVMLDAEHEIKDGFVINKFDVFIADMNEILADIVQRCNAASSMQMEQLWSKVKNGERWAIAKRLIETSKSHNDFASYLQEKSKKDTVFKGTLLEFCYRYQNLTALLEKHDRDRVFITILETGVMGKAFSILAPIVDAIDFTYENIDTKEQEETINVSEHILQMQEPERTEPSISIWKKLNPFKQSKQNKSNVVYDEKNDDDFFAALEKSMTSPEEKHQNYKNNTDENTENQELPHLGLLSSHKDEIEDFTPRLTLSADMTDEKTEPFIEMENNDKQIEQTEELKIQNSNNDDNFAYPFGNWINEENYKK